MPISPLPPAIEIARLRRLKEAVIDAEPKRLPAMLATADWIAEIDARLAALEQACRPCAA